MTKNMNIIERKNTVNILSLSSGVMKAGKGTGAMKTGVMRKAAGRMMKKAVGETFRSIRIRWVSGILCTV